MINENEEESKSLPRLRAELRVYAKLELQIPLNQEELEIFAEMEKVRQRKELEGKLEEFESERQFG